MLLNKFALNTITQIEDYLLTKNIDYTNFFFDHICFTCGSKTEYDAFKKSLDFNSKFIYQSIISGRRVAYIGLNHPIITIAGSIKYLELSDQDANMTQKTGFAHVELVPKNTTFDNLVKYVKTLNVELKINNKNHGIFYDIILPSGFKMRLSETRLVDKIYHSEMNL